jgi:hypothetical protein
MSEKKKEAFKALNKEAQEELSNGKEEKKEGK